MPLALRPPLLVRALDAVIAAAPCRAPDIEQSICSQRISKQLFRVEGVLSAALVLGLKAPVTVRQFGNERLVPTSIAVFKPRERALTPGDRNRVHHDRQGAFAHIHRRLALRLILLHVGAQKRADQSDLGGGRF